MYKNDDNMYNIGQQVKYFDELCTVCFIHESGLINLQKADGFYYYNVHPSMHVKIYDPHEASYVKCDLCGFKWVAVRSEGLTKLECKQCGNMVYFENLK